MAELEVELSLLTLCFNWRESVGCLHGASELPITSLIPAQRLKGQDQVSRVNSRPRHVPPGACQGLDPLDDRVPWRTVLLAAQSREAWWTLPIPSLHSLEAALEPLLSRGWDTTSFFWAAMETTELGFG